MDTLHRRGAIPRRCAAPAAPGRDARAPYGDIGIASNGYWGADAVRARSVVAEARGRGVSGISLSIDAFHQPGVSSAALENAAAAVAEAGMRRHSWLVLSLLPGDAAEADATNRASRALAHGVSERTGLPVAEIPIRPIGRGARLGENRMQGLPDGPCRDLATCLGETGPFDPRMIWIDPYGNVMICYGIAIGNLRDAPLARLLERYDPRANPITRALAEEGPIGLYRMAVDRGQAPAPRTFRDECDLCFHSRRAMRSSFSVVLLPDECYPGP